MLFCRCSNVADLLIWIPKQFNGVNSHDFSGQLTWSITANIARDVWHVPLSCWNNMFYINNFYYLPKIIRCHVSMELTFDRFSLTFIVFKSKAKLRGLTKMHKNFWRIPWWLIYHLRLSSHQMWQFRLLRYSKSRQCA